MIKAVLFDMYETLVTLYGPDRYMGKAIAADMGVTEPVFREIWDAVNEDRSCGRIRFEEVIDRILKANNRYSEALLNQIVAKRKAFAHNTFSSMHSGIVPMLQGLRANGIKIGLVTNCFLEEKEAIEESVLFSYFDAVCMSCDLGITKPDRRIFDKCVEMLGVRPEECIYCGDGGSKELEAAKSLNMKPVQALWYLQEGAGQPVGRLPEFEGAKSPMDIVTKAIAASNYSHYVSLGYFCSVALELERIGLRSTSSPFDWNISGFEGVINAVNSHFRDFLNPDFFEQSEKNRERYFNTKYNIWFFHDFDKYHSLESMLPDVIEKYDRRIKRFYEDISEPTLFVRYISDEKRNENGKSVELDYIENHYQEILSVLKSFNENNNILFIANTSVNSDVVNIFNVDKDENDKVARKFLEKNEALSGLLTSCKFEAREKNLEVFHKKQKNNRNIFKVVSRKISSLYKRMFLREYVHDSIRKE